ncbi:MAG: toll/interleukin-1 receptor domain-containing protein [Pyrinomonadaceae bacterium]
MPNEVFLSHAHEDRQFADAWAEVVRSHGIPVWYSKTNILGAQQWHDEIGAALQRCDWFALVLSPHAVESQWVKRELLYALDHKRYDKKIIPMMYQGCDYEERLSWTLSIFQMVDFTGTPDEGYVELLRIWGLGYRPG